MNVFPVILFCILLTTVIACGNSMPMANGQPPAAEPTAASGPQPSNTRHQDDTGKLADQGGQIEPSPKGTYVGTNASVTLKPTPTATPKLPVATADKYTGPSEAAHKSPQPTASATAPIPTEESPAATLLEATPSQEEPRSGSHVIRASVITVGSYFACALDLGGTPSCWNLIGEVDWHPWGGEDLGDLPVPHPPEDEKFVAISSGTFHVCGLREEGTVVCWGVSDSGELPPWNSGLKEVRFTSLNTQGCYTCGLLQDGTPLCWEYAVQPEICLWEPFELAPPPAGETFVEIVGIEGGSCGLRREGTFLCWAGLVQDEEVTTPIPGQDERFTSISHGGWQFCALRQEGSPTCWYWNVVADGWARGDDPLVSSLVSVSAGAFHACGLRDNGTPACWKPLEELPVGNWPSEEERFVALASRDFFSCGLRTDGTHLCWSGGFPE